MKSNIEKVYSKLPKVELEKVELATQKVELALIQDIQKAKTASSDSIESSDRLNDYANKIALDRKSLLTSLDGQIKDANNIFAKSGSILSKSQEAAAALGVPTKEIKGYDELEKNLNVLARSIDTSIRAKKSLS
tara:strand:+ start:32 stop:433 length:402 start_codon:yes stop_codon:yes gene_type:complete